MVKPVGGLLRPGGPYARPDAEMAKVAGFSRDINAQREEAKKLLREAGVPDGFQFTLKNRDTPNPYETIGVFLIDQWRQIGVKVDHQQLELAAYFSSMSSGNYEVIVDSFTDYSPDPNTGVIKYISTDRSPQAFSRHTDRKLDELFDLQAKTTDKVERRKLVRQLDIALDDGDPARGSLRAGTTGATGLVAISAANPLDDANSHTVCASL